jgi:DNA-binding XRE family transcriptional regulator
MSRPLPRDRKWIEPQDFRDLRRQSGLTRKQAARELDVTPRTIQNWETGGARIPWLAFRMLRILRGYALPGQQWEGWTVRDGFLISPQGRFMDAGYLGNFEMVFAQAKLWRQMYAASGRAKTASTVLPFPDRRANEANGGGYGAPPKALEFPERRQASTGRQTAPQGPLKRAGGTR